jgi:hypothetical protein
MEKQQVDNLISAYDEYVGLLGEEILDLKSKSWTGKRMKRGAELRARIAELKNRLHD